MKIALVGIGNVANAGLGFLFLAASAKFLTLEDFGRYALVTSLLITFGRLIDFGTNSLFVSKTVGKGQAERPLLQIFYTAKLILFVIAALLAIPALWVLNIFSLQNYLIFVSGLLAYGISYILHAFYQKEEAFIQLVLVNTLPALIKGAFAFAIFTGRLSLGLSGYYAVFTFSLFSGGLMALFIPREYKFPGYSFSKTINFIKEAVAPGISQLIFEAWPSLSNSFAKLANNFTDVGIFSLANKLSTMFTIISFSIFTVLLPKNALRKKKKESYDFVETGVISVTILVASIFIVIFSKFFIETFFGSKFSESVVLLDILVFASAFTAIQSFMENYFFVHQETNYLAKISLIKLGIFLLLTAGLIPIYGLVGLAFGNLVAALAGVGLTVFFIYGVERIARGSDHL